MKNLINLFLVYIGLTFISSCKEEFPSSLKTDGNPPGQISDILIQNLNGGSLIRYKLPSDEDLLYVKAEYEYPKGTKREVRSSLYVDSLKIEGIGSTQPLDILIYTVSRSEISSEPIKVTINPLTPPIYLIKESLDVMPDFGGFSIKYNNESKQDIVIEILKKIDNNWTNLESYYTNSKTGLFAVRGQDAELSDYAFYVRDKWKNKSRTNK